MTRRAEPEVLTRLKEEGEKKGLSSRFLEFYGRLWRIQSRIEEKLGDINPGLSRETISRRLEQGSPILKFGDLVFDWALFRDTFTDIAAVFADYPDIFGEIPEGMKRPKSRPSVPKKIVRAWFESAQLPATIAVEDANEYLRLEAIIHAAMKPFLARHSQALLKLVNQERWRRNFCPLCGGRPDFSFLDKESGARRLLCSRCDSEWLFQRLQCPYCGTQDQNALSYFADDKGVYRLYVCEQCHKYIKAIDLRSIKAEVVLPLERVLTLDMDRQAQEKGYQPGYSEALPHASD